MKKYLLLIVVLVFFYSLAVIMWQATGAIFYLMNFIIIGSCVGLGAGLWPIFPKKKKFIARLISQISVGSYLFFGLGCGLIYLFFGYIVPENMQMEGFWILLFSGVFMASVIHYMVAKIAGPLLFNRVWCSWACWTASILDLLPWKKSPGRYSKKLENLRYIHFSLSLFLMAMLFFVFKHSFLDNMGAVSLNGQSMDGIKEYSSLFKIPEFWWFIAGNTFYFLSGIVLAAVLKDNRAFCKYLCPIVVFLKISARFSKLKVKKVNGHCNLCMACEKNCPMDIKITEYTENKMRVSSTECIICQTCISTCPKKVLELSFGFDGSKGEFLNRIDLKA
ncbi:MAG: 4Fe-4S binding protein [Bacteroidetes bacterium]|nr:4Fe-4S binding protein [Bacteroidota bacterium]